jgi:hypothetical protein
MNQNRLSQAVFLSKKIRHMTSSQKTRHWKDIDGHHFCQGSPVEGVNNAETHHENQPALHVEPWNIHWSFVGLI